MQHATGLYDKIRNINTPQDIAKWIEERKKRFPNKENIVKRQQEVEERWKRGERITANDNRFGRDKFRLQKRKIESRNSRAKQMLPKKNTVKKVSLFNEKHDWNGTMFPFRGTASLEAVVERDSSEYEDDEWEPRRPGHAVVKLNNALSGLMGAYASDSASDNEECKMGIVNNQVVRMAEVKPKIPQATTTYQGNQSDGEPPDEIKTEKIVVDSTISKESTPGKQKVALKGNVRKRKRGPGTQRNPKKMNRSSVVAGTSKQHEFPYGFKKRKVTLLEKLLQSEVRHERNVILQCVRYIVNNNFFKS
nr:unnamed protein product [Callosobruchus chinensis]